MLRTALIAGVLTFAFSYAVAQEAPELPPNTIDCTAFVKARDGNWRVGAPTTFDIGTAKRITLGGVTVRPLSVPLGGGDLYDALESKCAGWS
jgi:hypothetical protein